MQIGDRLGIRELLRYASTSIDFAQLEDLFVSPEYRNYGVGKALFAELAKVAEEKVSGSIGIVGDVILITHW